MRIAVIANTSWYLFNFRLNLMRALIDAGHEVVAIGPLDSYVPMLVNAGIRHRSIPLDGAGINPFREMLSVWELYRILKKESIDLVFSYTPKGNIYSALASLTLGLPFVPNVSGLGRVFIRRSLLTTLVKYLYRYSFSRAKVILFQNNDDMELFVGMGLAQADRAERIPGSGVDLNKFTPSTEGSCSGRSDDFVFLLVARLLWDKGIGEFVDAARLVLGVNSRVEFRVLGFLDSQNPSAISQLQVEAWVSEGVISYLGATDDVLPHIAAADCIVLPSYREGVPRTLLEAAAMAKPIIATDAPGCRDAVDEGLSGLLCKVGDASDLAKKMFSMLEMERIDLAKMGKRGREKMLGEFDEGFVIARYLRIVGDLEHTPSSL